MANDSRPIEINLPIREGEPVTGALDSEFIEKVKDALAKPGGSVLVTHKQEGPSKSPSDA
jgi:hypothetical protein